MQPTEVISLAIFGTMRWLFILVVFLITSTGQKTNAQEALPFVTDVELNRNFSDSRIGSMVQNGEDVMLFSTSRGLLKYDGSDWERIATPSPVLRVYHHKISNRVFVGLKTGAAEVLKSDSGEYLIKPIAEISSELPIQQIIGTDKEVFFIGENAVFALEPLSKELAVVRQFPSKFISGAFIYEKQLHILMDQEGLFRLEEGVELKEIPGHVDITEDLVLFSFETINGTFIGFENDLLYRFDGDKFQSIESNLQEFLSHNILSDGLLLNDSLMALSTLAGGAVIANVSSNEITYRFDYTTGTKDNEIFCLGTDRDNGLWLAYDAGLSRIDLAQPIKNYKGFPGLDGNLTTSLISNGVLHVGTGNGVFVLKKATNRAEINRMMQDMMRKQREAKKQIEFTYVPRQQYLATREQKKNAKQKEVASLMERFMANPEEAKADFSKKENRDLKREMRRQRKDSRKRKSVGEAIQDFFTGGSDKAETDSNRANENSGQSSTTGLIPNPRMGSQGSGMTAPPGSRADKKTKPQVLNQQSDKKTTEAESQKIEELRKSFLFKKISGIDVKCRQLISVKNQVFAATNNGLYLIKGEGSSNLTPGLYINYVTVSADGKKLFIASLDGVHELATTENGEWAVKTLNDSVQFVAYNIVESSEGDVWAGTDNGAYRYSNGQAKFYAIPDVLNERVLVSKAYGEIHFLLPNALFHFVVDTDTILPATLPEFPISDRLDYLLGNDDIIWIKSDLGWSVLNGEKITPLLPYLDLFEDIIHLSTDTEGNIYVIDKGADLYSVMNRNEDSEYKFNVYIKKVVDANGQPFSLQEMKIETEDGALIFNVSAPFYLKSKGTLYQFRIEGHRNNWSKWDDKSEIDPGNFSPGDYVLEVRAKNILGEVSEIKTLAFSIPPPLFRRWYFLLLYALLLSLLIFGIIKVRESSLRETQRILEDKVAQRTSELESEKGKTEELLLNILPKDTAEELQKNGKATARHYNQVSVLFTDFKGFTEFAENTKPEDLVNELHRCFVGFDEIIGKYYLEKIKTIGDAYMCAGGVPIRNNSNAIAITLASLEIRDFMTQVILEKRAKNEPILEIRIGMHTGPLTAGVVGLKKFAYDIWGDTVNTASRMESTSEPGKINVSGPTYQLIKKYFDCEFRGKKQVKGKGMVEMYFVNSIKVEFSENGDQKTPNKGLWELIS
jgi:class 3 adenylate cyclase